MDAQKWGATGTFFWDEVYPAAWKTPLLPLYPVPRGMDQMHSTSWQATSTAEGMHRIQTWTPGRAFIEFRALSKRSAERGLLAKAVRNPSQTTWTERDLAAYGLK